MTVKIAKSQNLQNVTPHKNLSAYSTSLQLYMHTMPRGQLRAGEMLMVLNCHLLGFRQVVINQIFNVQCNLSKIDLREMIARLCTTLPLFGSSLLISLEIIYQQ